MFLSSCQKAVLPLEEGGEVPDAKTSLTFHISSLEQIPFDIPMRSRGTDVKSICSRLQLAVYQGGNKVAQVNQVSGDEAYGTLNLRLDPGKYELAIIAHSGEKNASMAHIDKITFDGKLTDTFYYHDSLTVGEDAGYDIKMKRAVGMFRLVISDAMPQGITTMRFYYTGGSSTFDARHGVGCVSSRQNEMLDVTSDMIGKPTVFEVYTFPRADSKSLDMQVTALKQSNIQVQKEFKGIPIARNMVTQYKGSFFGGPSEMGDDAKTLVIKLISEDEWTVNENYY